MHSPPPEPTRGTSDVESRLGHTFSDPALLERALTHASTGAERDNERLEFLGDAVLDLVVAEILFAQKPERSEGELTELKSWVVSRRPLAEASRELGLEDDSRLGPGLAQRALPDSVLANLYEAVLGALYLDAGLETARAFVHRTLARPLGEAATQQTTRNPKQDLQHVCQRLYSVPPRYLELETRGQAHARAYLMCVMIQGERFPSAWGRTRKEAESWAAHEALIVLRERDLA